MKTPYVRFECSVCRTPMVVDGVAFDHHVHDGADADVRIVKYRAKPSWFDGTPDDFAEGRPATPRPNTQLGGADG